MQGQSALADVGRACQQIRMGQAALIPRLLQEAENGGVADDQGRALDPSYTNAILLHNSQGLLVLLTLR
jgi:hypothetical protein